jgi:hypothetical protein
MKKAGPSQTKKEKPGVARKAVHDGDYPKL